MNNEQNKKIMTYAQATTTAQELTAHIENHKIRKGMEITLWSVLYKGWSKEAAKIALDFMMEPLEK